MNSPGPFAFFMMAGLLTLIEETSIFGISASIVGYLSFLLSQLRTAWLGWFVALLFIFSSLKSKYQIRLIVVFTVMAMIAVPVANTEPFSDTINSRLETVVTIQDDVSGRGRLLAYENLLNNPQTALVGIGIGNKKEALVWDSGILEIFSSLGWLGGSCYLGGMLKLMFDLGRFSLTSRDRFINVAYGIAISILFMLPLAVPHTDVMGICLWGFLCIGLSGKKYYRNRNFISTN